MGKIASCLWKLDRVMQALLQMKKLDIRALQQAYER